MSDDLQQLRDAVAAKTNNDKRLPDSSFAAQYPWNATHVSRSGHEFHIDDTPGGERLRQAHRTGSYWEISPDGRKVTLTTSDETHYVKGGLTITIDNNEDIVIGGNARIVVKGDAYTEVHGNMTTVVGKDATLAVMGNAISAVSGDAFTKVKGSMHTSVEGNMNAEIKGDAEMSVQGNVAMVSKGNVEMEGQRVRITANGGPLVLKGTPVQIVQG